MLRIKLFFCHLQQFQGLLKQNPADNKAYNTLLHEITTEHQDRG